MPDLDSSAKAAVAGHFAPAWYIYLDFAGDELRFTTCGSDTTFASTGDSDLDGHTFVAFGGELIEVGDVSNSDSGSNTLNVTLSGILGLDSTLLDEIGDTSKWQGQLARLWFQLYDASGDAPQGAIVQYYTGYMSKVTITASPGQDGQPGQQQIQLSIENYLAYTTQASNRSYLSQSTYDPADTSAAASIAASNGLRSSSGNGGSTPAGRGGGLPAPIERRFVDPDQYA